MVYQREVMTSPFLCEIQWRLIMIISTADNLHHVQIFWRLIIYIADLLSLVNVGFCANKSHILVMLRCAKIGNYLVGLSRQIAYQ